MSSAQVESVAGFVLLAIVVMVLCYLLPAAIRSRQMVADARIDDRFSTGLRVLARAGETPSQYLSTARVYLHTPGGEPEAPMDRQPVPPASRAAAQARRDAAMRAARAAAASRRAAAARRRRVLLVSLVVLTAAAWALFATISLPLAVPVAASVLLVGAGVSGRRAAVRAARADAREQTADSRARRPARAVGEVEQEPTTTSAGSLPVRHARRASAGEAASGAIESDVEAPGGAADDAADSEAAPPTRTPVSERTGSLRISVDPATIEEAGSDSEQTEEGWTPVPVPVPTYALKASAPRRQVPAYEAPEWEVTPPPADAHQEREMTLAEVEQAVRERQDDQAPQATEEQVLAEQAASPARTAAASGESAGAERQGMDLQSVLERRRAVGQ